MNTSKRPSRFLIIILIIIGVAVLGSESDTANKPTVDERYTPDKEINRVQIVNGSCDIVFKTGDQVMVEGKNLIKDSYSFTTKNDTLIVATKINKHKFLNFNFFEDSSRITITLPEGIKLDKLTVENGSGDVSLGKLDTEDFELSLGSGNIEINNIWCNKLDIVIGSGELEFDGLEANSCMVKVGSGDFVGERLKVATISVKVGSGDIELDGVIDKDSDFVCKSGDIDLDLEGELKDYSFDLDGEDIEINGEDYATHYVSKETSEKNMKIECGSGDIEVSIR